MNILVVGINHKTAPIEIREKFYLKTVERELILSDFKNNPSVSEALVISTCNRTEIYANMIEKDSELLLKVLSRVKNISIDVNLKKYVYSYSNEEAVRHLFCVSAGLDSLILGEKQILGQIKEAAELSRKKSMMLKSFNILSNIAIRVGKKARTETQIDCGGSSVSWAAVRTAQDALGTLEGKLILIVGAGKMGKLAVNQMKDKGVKSIHIVNRTYENSQVLAREVGGIAASFWDLKEILSQADVCICSASCSHYLIEKDLVEEVMATRRQKKLICVDISMPRNINPNIASVANVSLFSIDDLDKVVEDNVNKRRAAVEQVQRIINQKLNEFYAKLNENCLEETVGNYEKISLQQG